MSETPLLGLPLMESGQAQKHVTHNEALLLLDAAIHLSVISRTLATPPVTPADGDRYLVAAAATAAWAGHSGQLAVREAGSWRFSAPRSGWRLWVESEIKFLVFDGTIWRDVQGAGDVSNVPLLGVNATADTTNRLTVSSDAALFTHDGGGHQIKINKQAAIDTASLLYQTNFSGRAEMGLAGDDDFHVKVSADGSAWNEAIVVNRSTGSVSFPNTVAGGVNLPRTSVRDYGAVGSSTAAAATTDYTAALNAALATGKPVSGDGLWYAVTGNISLPDGADLADIKIKQLTPGGTNVRTLTNGSGYTKPMSLRRVTVNRNGTPSTASTIADYAGVWLDGITDLTLEDIEVHGDGAGSGIAISNCNRVKIVRPYVRDIEWYKAPDPLTEQVIGLWIRDCTNVSVGDPAIRNLTGSTTVTSGRTVETAYQTDGLNITGCSNVTVMGGRIKNVGEGSDVTGSGTNSNIWFFGTVYEDIDSWGQKWVHEVLDSGAVGCRAYRCGYAGFVVAGGTSPDDAFGPTNIRLSACMAFDTGSNGFWAAQNVAGLRITDNTFAPVNVVVTDFVAVDRQGVPTMKYGVYSDPNAPGAVRLLNPFVSGATVLAYDRVSTGVYRPEADGTHAFFGEVIGQTNVSAKKGLVARGYLATQRNVLTLANGANAAIDVNQSYIRIGGPTAAFSVDGIKLINNDSDGPWLWLHNTTAQAMTIKHESGSEATLSRRIKCLTGADVVLPARNTAALFIYDGTISRWLLLGSFDAASGGGGGGSGDVVGPASAVDNAIVRFDATTGKLVQSSDVTLNDDKSMTLSSVTSDPAAPAADQVIVMARTAAGRARLAQRSAAGALKPVQDALAFTRVVESVPVVSGTTYVGNASGITSVGTAAGASLSAATRWSQEVRIEHQVTVAAATAIGGFRTSSAQNQFFRGANANQGGFYFVCRWGPATGVATATNRCFVGLIPGYVPTDVQPSTLLNMCGMGWDSADANIQFFHNDGSGTASKIDSGIAVPSTDRTNIFDFEMYCPPNGSEVFFKFTDITNGNSFSASGITDLPVNNQLMSAHGWLSAGGTSSVIGFGMFRMRIETD